MTFKPAELCDQSLLDRAINEKVRSAAIRAMGFLTDGETGRWLDEHRTKVMATGALARRGDKAAILRLGRQSRTDSTALAVFLDTAPAAAAGALRKRLLGPDEDEATRTIYLIAELTPAGDFWQDVTWDDRWFEGVPDAALRGRFPGERLARIGTYVPGCRDRRLAGEAVRLLRETPPSAEFLMDFLAGAFLELGAGGEHVERPIAQQDRP